MGRRIPPPKIGDKVWICIPEHWYPDYLYPEFKDADVKYDAAPAEAVVKRLLFFEKGAKLKPEVVCMTNLRGNPNNVHYIRWSNDVGKQLFYNREDCIKRCEELADIADTKGLDAMFGYKRIRPWRIYGEII